MSIEIPSWAREGQRVYIVRASSFGIGIPAPSLVVARVSKVYKRYVTVSTEGSSGDRRFNFRPGIAGREFLEAGRADVFGDWIIPGNDKRVRRWLLARAAFDVRNDARTLAKLFVADPGTASAYALRDKIEEYLAAEEESFTSE